MGIQNFHSWVKKKYPDVIQKYGLSNKISYDNLYIDLNFCLHFCVYNSKTEITLIKKLYGFLDNVINLVKPTKKIIFAADGSASMAKLLLQRKRRLMMVRSESFNNINFNPLAFTPGTDFMNNLEGKIKSYTDKLNNIETEFIINGAGESEFKLLDYYKNNYNKKENNILLSNDADIVAMILSLDKFNNINVLMKQNDYFLFDINKFYNQIIENIKDKTIKLNYDISLLFIMLGNDYLPKVNYLNIDKTINNYIELINKENKTIINKTQNILNFNNEILKKFLLKVIFSINKGYINKFNLSDLNEKQYSNYLEGLIWCISDYSNTSNNCITYTYNYNKSPHPLGIYYYLAFNDKQIKYPECQLKKPIDNNIYALIVMPKKAQYLITNNNIKIINKECNYLFSEEECNICIESTKKINNLNASVKYLNNLDLSENQEKIDELKQKIKNLNVEFLSHRKIKHKNINGTDILKSIEVLTK